MGRLPREAQLRTLSLTAATPNLLLTKHPCHTLREKIPETAMYGQAVLPRPHGPQTTSLTYSYAAFRSARPRLPSYLATELVVSAVRTGVGS